jgi:hypothetical protein
VGTADMTNGSHMNGENPRRVFIVMVYSTPTFELARPGCGWFALTSSQSIMPSAVAQRAAEDGTQSHGCAGAFPSGRVQVWRSEYTA